MQQVQGFVVLLDISGYTRFIRSHNLRHVPVLGKGFREASEAHGEQVVTDLLETLLNATSDILRPEKLEGDAILMSAVPDDQTEFARTLVSRLQDVFRIFHERIRDIAFCTTCLCDCCSKMGELKVKAIAHHGPFLIKQVANFREIAGQEVIRAHRLLKNSVDSDEYLMLTEPVVKLADATASLSMEAYHEDDPDLGTTKVWVHFPENHSALEEDLPESYLKQYGKMRAYFREERDREALIPAAK